MSILKGLFKGYKNVKNPYDNRLTLIRVALSIVTIIVFAAYLILSR